MNSDSKSELTFCQETARSVIYFLDLILSLTL